jgi:putative tricarboxylic transport membrane protein
MKISDLAIGVFLVALGLGILGYGISLPPMPGQRYGAGLFPMLLGVAFAGFGAQLAHQGWKQRAISGAPLIKWDDWARSPRLVVNMLLVLGMILVYMLLAERIGFIVLSLAMLLFLFWWFGVPLLRSVAIAVSTTAFIYIGFVRFLRVPLPRGVLSGILW